MGLIERARELREVIERLALTLDDAEAAENAELFPAWDGASHPYVTGDKVQYDGVVYKVLQDHSSQDGWTPTAAPSLFAKVHIPTNGATIPVWEQPDSTNPYMQGDRVRYPDEVSYVYESLINNNVWSPAAYPAGWKQVTV